MVSTQMLELLDWGHVRSSIFWGHRVVSRDTHRHVPGHVVTVRTLIVPALRHETHVTIVRETPL